jgi:benzoyl-CoA reductase/2-hydroxyglutaryl-CoA dehydratase subunit BcrC/BadD/HgdB
MRELAAENAREGGGAHSEPPETAEACRPELDNNTADLGRRGDLDAALLNARGSFHACSKISLEEWDRRYESHATNNGCRLSYTTSLTRHADDGDRRLRHLQFDPSDASLRLWNLLLSEEERLHAARRAGHTLVGVMKDLGTVPIIAYACDRVTAFYPDGAWWTPCIMEASADSLRAADAAGIDESFCPVRAMLGAFVTGEHFPRPDCLICSVGATCDDVTALAERIADLGHDVFWWEIPHRRRPEAGEPVIGLPDGTVAPAGQVAFVQSELVRVREVIEGLTGRPITDQALVASIERANLARGLIAELRHLCFTAPACPLPALELLIAEMLALHFCSDPTGAVEILTHLLDEVRRRVRDGVAVLPHDNVPVFWVNPVADLQVMNLLEDCGGRICGTEYLISHALNPIPADQPPMEALAGTALADPMIGSAHDRAAMIARQMEVLGSRAAIISRIPGASHCATEGLIIAEHIRRRSNVPVVEIEVPPISDGMRQTLRSRIEAAVEIARHGGSA